MPVFKRNNGTPITGPITLVIGDTLRVKLDGLPKNAVTVIHFTIQSNVPNTVTITQNPDQRQREQVITLKANQATELVTVKAHHADGKAADCGDVATCVPPLQIRIVSKIALPAENTEAGLLTKLLLTESVSPADRRAYGDGEEVLKTMRLMRIVVENRVKAAQASENLKSYVACNPATNDVRGVIFADRCGSTDSINVQFRGYENGTINAALQANIDDILKYANTGTHDRFSLYRKHVEEAILVASGPNLSSEPLSSSSLLYWRTAKSGSPSGHAEKKFTQGGQDFYTLKDGFLKDPVHYKP